MSYFANEYLDGKAGDLVQILDPGYRYPWIHKDSEYSERLSHYGIDERNLDGGKIPIGSVWEIYKFLWNDEGKNYMAILKKDERFVIFHIDAIKKVKEEDYYIDSEGFKTSKKNWDRGLNLI